MKGYMMEKLIKAYLDSKQEECVAVHKINPCAVDGEHGWEVIIVNGWVEGNVEVVHVSISELMSFMYEQVFK
jgi:hypothetical protein